MDRESGDEESIEALARKLSNVVMASKSLTLEDVKALSDFANQLMNVSCSPKTTNSVESQLIEIQTNVLRHKTNNSQLSDLLHSVGETQKFILMLESSGISDTSDGLETLHTARSVLQTAMEITEEEFRIILEENKHSYGAVKLVPSSRDNSGDLQSLQSPCGDSCGSSTCRDSGGWSSQDLGVNTIGQSTVSDLKAIVNSMVLSGYGLECSNAYIAARRYCLEDSLVLLRIEKLGIESVRKLEWCRIHSMMKKWARGMKKYVKSCLVGEKLLAKSLFGNEKDTYLKCFCEIAKPTMSQVLSFGEAVSIGPHKPEQIEPMLHMYEALFELLPDLDSLFVDEIDSSFHSQYQELMKTLGEAIIAALKDFNKEVARCDSSRPIQRGVVHPVTSYVMNYLNILFDYQSSIDTLLATNEQDDSSPMAKQFLTIVNTLIANLQDQAKAYKDPSLQHIFLMNNIWHVVKKIKNSDLQGVFGSPWIKEQIALYRSHALKYERTTWRNVLDVLKDEGAISTNSKGNLKEKFRRFYAGFEEIYRTQTGWSIPDKNLREDVRISLSITVIQAYAMFLRDHGKQVSEKHVKYSAEDLTGFLEDFFEGNEKTLVNPHREDMSIYGRLSFLKRDLFHG